MVFILNVCARLVSLFTAHHVVYGLGVTITDLEQLSLVHPDPSNTSPPPGGEDRRWALHSLVSHYIYANETKIRGNLGASFPVSAN